MQVLNFSFSLGRAAVLALALGGAAVEAQTTDTLRKLQDSGKITLGVRESSIPFSYVTNPGEYAGYHVELCQRIVANLRKLPGLQALAVSYQPVTPQNRISLVQNGTVDLECGNTTNTASRQQQVAFGLTTYLAEVRMLVHVKSGVNSIKELHGKSVVTTAGSTTVQHLRKHERASGIDVKEIYAKDHAEAFLTLEGGRADAYVMDDNVLAGMAALAKNPADYRIVGEVLSTEPIALMLRKDDAAFKQVVDETILGMTRSGEMARLYAKWFVEAIPPRNVALNLPMQPMLRTLLAEPNDRPMEAYARPVATR